MREKERERERNRERNRERERAKVLAVRTQAECWRTSVMFAAFGSFINIIILPWYSVFLLGAPRAFVLSLRICHTRCILLGDPAPQIQFLDSKMYSYSFHRNGITISCLTMHEYKALNSKLPPSFSIFFIKLSETALANTQWIVVGTRNWFNI